MSQHSQSTIITNRFGGFSEKGIGNTAKWEEIHELALLHPDWTQHEIAEAAKISQSVVSKVLHKASEGITTPHTKTVLSTREHVFSEWEKKLLDEIITYNTK